MNISTFIQQPEKTVVIDLHDLHAIIDATHSHPHRILGMHPVVHNNKKGVVVRAWVHDSVDCAVVDYTGKEETRYPMKKLHEWGFYEVFIEDKEKVFPYCLRVMKHNGEIRQFYDSYSFLPTLSEEDLHLFNEGRHFFAYEKLGAQCVTHQGVEGVSFAVWAPSAQRISVVGDFTEWNGRYMPMRQMGASGIWELFVPGLGEGLHYKYEIRTASGQVMLKSDPYANYYESPPHNASITYDTKGYQWSDDAWMKKRASTEWKKEAVSIYEVHFGSWRRIIEDNNRPFSYREMAPVLTQYVLDMKFTHVEFMPLAEHPFDGSWGYQVTGFFAPTHRFGTPKDFMYLVDYLHQHNIGVIVDWVPAHFPKDAFALARFDGTALYEHDDPRQGEHRDWGTLIFNYGRHEVRGFLINSALAWLKRFHVDGFRVDAVASMLYLDYSREEGDWIPNQYGGHENIEAIEFLRLANDTIHEYFPGVLTIAEESTAFGRVTWPTKEFGLGFDLKWNMGWMHDTLSYFTQEPIFRKHHHHKLTFGMLYQYGENYTLVFSHDEVVHGKGSILMKMGSWYFKDKANTLRSLYALMWAWPGKKTLFMGLEFGQTQEWKYDVSLDWHLLTHAEHTGVQNLVRDLNHWYADNKSLAHYDFNQEGFEWINTHDTDNSVLSFIRKGDDPSQVFLYIGNFTPVRRANYRVGVPLAGIWKEVINTDATEYAGNGAGNLGQVISQPVEWNARPHSVEIVLPPLSSLIFKYEKPIEEKKSALRRSESEGR